MNLAERDQAAIWHPYTQHKTSPLPIAIRSGKGAYLFDESGNRYLDLISSWWTNIHGHAEPTIAKAIYDQALTLEHTIFSHFTHEPAVVVAETILKLLPKRFSKVFYSDNGSTAVEAALKMAYQYWRNAGEPQRNRFLAFQNGYHGDTFGAMAVGKKSGFFNEFEALFFPVDFIPFPATWMGDEKIVDKEDQLLQALTTHLEEFGQTTAAFIMEPLVQGAGGMHICRPEFLQKLETLLRRHDILIIYDEVMTGFGRTGDFFACGKTKTTPDIICLAKGLTGGFLPLALTVCTEKIYQAFLDDHFGKALAHGHTYTANPLGCAAAIASLHLLQQETMRDQWQTIEKIHQTYLQDIMKLYPDARTRYAGTIAAFELPGASAYGSSNSVKLRDHFLEKNILVRPLGNTLYLMPPYCITSQELEIAYQSILEVITEKLGEFT